MGNLTRETDPNNNPATQHTPDALNRLVQTIDRLGGTTAYGYDVNDRVKQVIAPNNASTTYEYDDLGNLLKETSLDRGTTNYTHDTAGNVLGLTNALGQVTAYSYDALNRPTFADAPGTDFDVTYVYDTCTQGVGRLCSMSNSFATVAYDYDGLGNVISHQSLGYTYTTAGRLRTISYPSSAVVTFDYDTAGQVSQVTLTRNGATQVIASGIQYMPFGPIKAMNYGNGKTLAQTWDSAYRVRLQTVSGVLQLDYTQYDGNDNLLQRLDTIASQWSNFAYDPLDRLDTASGGFGSRDYDYDGNGNRTRLTEGAVVTNYVYAHNTNRLMQAGTEGVIVDVVGNVTARDTRTYLYSPGFHYLTQALDNGSPVASYAYNTLGQRIAKQTGSITTSYTYGLDGFLRVETPQGGTPREYIYLGDQPLAVLEPASGMLGVQPGFPSVSFNQGGPATRYDAGTGAFQVDSQPVELRFQASDVPYFTFGTLALRIFLNDGCHVAAGDAGPDLIVTGDVYDPNTFNLVLSGTLLTGEIVAAGAASMTTSATGFDFRFTATGGLLVTEGHWPVGKDVGLALTSMNSNFPGHCAANFSGGAQGNLGPVAPPSSAETGTLFYYHNDHRGTPRAMTDSAGDTVWKASYDPFGQATITTATITNNLRDAGMYADQETGLYYNWFRYYDPKIGGYITAEPLGVVPGIASSATVPQEITEYFRSLPLNERLLNGLNHPYRYVDNNPLRWIDPTGLDKTEWFNTSGGRSPWSGPTNGNWGGKCWSGGQYSCNGNSPGNAPPTDSADQCYQRHDDCYIKCGTNTKCIAACNRTLDDELSALPDDPRLWPRPPRPGTEGDSRNYKTGARILF
jgi:RHS repeat-associated protein